MEATSSSSSSEETISSVEAKFKEVDSNLSVVFSQTITVQNKVNELSQRVSTLEDLPDKLTALTDAINGGIFSDGFIELLTEKNNSQIEEYKRQLETLGDEMKLLHDTVEIRTELEEELSGENSQLVKDLITERLNKIAAELDEMKSEEELVEAIKFTNDRIAACEQKNKVLYALQ